MASHAVHTTMGSSRGAIVGVDCAAAHPSRASLPATAAASRHRRHSHMAARGLSASRTSGAVPQQLSRGSSRRAGPPVVVCSSSMRPLADSDGNVSAFEDEEEFNQILSDAGDKLVVVDISTTTCGPCKMIFPKLVEMSLDYPDVVFLKINGDTNNTTRSLMRKWGVRAVPNFRFFRNGELVHSHTGAKLDELRNRFAEYYGQPLKV